MQTWISASHDLMFGRDPEFECDAQQIKPIALETIENAKVAYEKIVRVTGGAHVKARHDVFAGQD